MIEVRHLHYTYPGSNTEVLHDLNFSIKEKEIFGFLGPSGAGKSTTQKILIGLLKDYQGRITVLGKELNEWGNELYERVGVSFELPNHYLKLTAYENLAFFGSLSERPTRDPLEVLSWVGLADAAHKRVSAFSKGMKIRLNVARSLLYKPQLLFLDEPTSGLDPVNARHIKDLILKLRVEGTTVLITTHDMTVADQLCDRVAFISDGKISVIDKPGTLRKQHGKRSVVVEYTTEQTEMESKEFPLDGLGENEQFSTLLETAHRIETIHTQETTLEDVFAKVTGEELSS